MTKRKRKVKDGDTMRLVQFHGASCDDSTGERVYTDRGPVWVNPEYVTCAYDHTVMLPDSKIRVMESGEEIKQCLTVSQQTEEADGQSE